MVWNSQSSKILIVDDDGRLRSGLAEVLVSGGYDVLQAADGTTARQLLDSDPDIVAVLCDVEMSGGSGVGVLAYLTADFPDIAIVITHGADDPETARLALEGGADGYLIKPFTTNEILISLASALRRRQLDAERTGHLRALEVTIGRLGTLTSALQRVVDATHTGNGHEEATIDRLSRALSLRGEGTGRHVERMSRYSALLAEASGIRTWSPDQIRLITALHDVGKIGVPDSILLKPVPLSPEESGIVRRHPQIGYQLLAGSTSDLLNAAAVVALTHHEWWDGGGYPSGLAGEDIPRLGRIAAITNVFDALTSNRVYRAGVTVDEAAGLMSELRGRRFDPGLLSCFLSRIDDVSAIRDAWPDGPETRLPIRVLIVDERTDLVDRLVLALAGEQTVTVVGTAASITEAERAAVATEPDVILVDLELPGAEGIVATERISALRPAAKVLMVTDRIDNNAFVRALGAGCAGFVSRSDGIETVIGTIRAAHEGDELPPSVELSVLLQDLTRTRRGCGSDLRPRELEILRLVAAGLSNKAIADQVHISLNTVRNHVQRILYKLDAHSRLEAVATAMREGLIGRDDGPPGGAGRPERPVRGDVG